MRLQMKHQFRTVINRVNRFFLERIEIRLLGFLLVASLLSWSSSMYADVHKFKVDQAGTHNFGVWQLTDDSAIREEANYHNTQCWSYNGRYTCYTRWCGADGVGGKSSAEIHIVDLKTGKDRLVGKGINPRWANQHNWLFFCHWTADGKAPYETGTQIIRYDADSGEKVEIVSGMESPGSLDATDTWLYGTQRYRGQKPEHIAVRVRNLPNSKLQKLPAAPNKHPHVDEGAAADARRSIGRDKDLGRKRDSADDDDDADETNDTFYHHPTTHSS